MTEFHLRIVTPDRLVFDGQAQSLIVRTTEGDLCVLANHTNCVTSLTYGPAKMTDSNGNVRLAACNNGVLSVAANDVQLAAVTFEWADEINLERAEHAKQVAEERLKSQNLEQQDLMLAEAKLKRALVRINVASK